MIALETNKMKERLKRHLTPVFQTTQETGTQKKCQK